MKKNISQSSSVNDVDEQEKALIIAEANRIGVRETAKKHGLTWQRVASWKKTAQENSSSKIIIQSPIGAEISAEEILAKVGEANQIYVRVDENKIYRAKERKTARLTYVENIKLTISGQNPFQSRPENYSAYNNISQFLAKQGTDFFAQNFNIFFNSKND